MNEKLKNFYIKKNNNSDYILFKNSNENLGEIIPKKLFRFRPLNEKFVYDNKKSNAELEIDNLISNLMYLSSPDNYNDPYDSKLLFDKYKFMKLFLKSKKCRSIYKINIEALIKQTNITKGVYPELFFDNLLNFFDLSVSLLRKMSSSLRISCFTENDFTNVLMWSHYASNHTGYCIEYDSLNLLNDINVCKFLYPVYYSREIFDISNIFINFIENMSDNLDSQNIKFIYCSAIFKAIEWNYEKEWRIITDVSNSNLINKRFLSMQKPKKIYLGTKIKEEYKNIIVDFCKKNDIDVYQMYLCENRYFLSAQQID